MIVVSVRSSRAKSDLLNESIFKKLNLHKNAKEGLGTSSWEGEGGNKKDKGDISPPCPPCLP
jgi:hypothetical protein